MDNVTHIFQIYKSCDPNNTNSVPASSLLNFIKPFMFEDLSELERLERELDPDGNDPAISSSVFQEVMSDWIAKIDKERCSSNLSEMANNNMKTGEEAERVFPSQSETFNLGLSQNNTSRSRISNSSNINNNTIALEEQIQKLQYQLHKTLKELELVKQQLASCEELNESLSSELNRLNKLHYHEQHLIEENVKNKQEQDDIQEEANLANRKMQEMGKALLDCEKEKEELQAQVDQLENENGTLKIQIEKLEKHRKATRKSVTELEDVVDSKDSEIATLMEVIDELKHKLDEKDDLVNFYMNENKLSKQKMETLENLFSDMFPDEVFSPKNMQLCNDNIVSYNSPKLLNQVSNPISPTMDTPVSFKNAGIVTVLRSPHKTLKEELSEASCIKFDEGEVRRLQEALKEQETIKNNLWQGMKHLSRDNENLREFKQEYQALLREKDEIIESLKNMTIAHKNNTICMKEDKSTVTEFEECLNEKDTRKFFTEDKSTETDEDKEQEELIQHLNEEIEMLQHDLEVEKEKIALLQGKEMLDKSIETDKEDTIWTIPVLVTTESKKTNYFKQQIKLEKLLEKYEKVERELNTERGQNNILHSKIQELNEENVRIKENLRFCETTNNEIIKNVKDLETERQGLQQEIVQLTCEKFTISQELQNCMDTLAVEKSIIHRLQIDNEMLMNRIRQFEINTKQECNREILLKKQMKELKGTYNVEIVKLQNNISERDAIIGKLQNEGVKIEWFLVEINEKLSNVISQCDIDGDVDGSFTNFKEIENELVELGLKKQLENLNKNVKLIIRLITINYLNGSNQNVMEKQSSNETYNISQSISSSSSGQFLDSEMITSFSSIEDEDSFMSACLDTFTNNEYVEMISFEADSFLDNLELNEGNLKNLSRQEMEEKFTTFALILTMDFATTNKRYSDQKEMCSRLFMNFCAYINHVLDLLRQSKRLSQTEVDKMLKLLKNLSDEVFKSAFQCGVLQYERRTINCWNLVINYVATLSQENKQNKNRGSDGTSPNLSKSLTPVPLQNKIKCTVKNDFVIQSRSSDPWKTFKHCIVTFVLIVFVLFVGLMLYVDTICVKHGRQVCPVEWFLSLFVKRVHSHLAL